MLDKEWFSEICHEAECAIALKIKGKLHEEQSAYQKIEVFETEQFGNLMVIDGFIMLTSRDNFLYHEMMSHPALYTHGNAKRVMIIGGGDCGTLREVLKHPEVESALQVEIDERVTRLAETYFPELCESNSDPRAEIFFGDGIDGVKRAKPGSYDVIIVDSTDPVGPGEGLFTREFYADCYNALDTGGIIVHQSESPLLHMDILTNMYQSMSGAGFDSVRTLFFPQMVYPSGWWSATMAGKGVDLESFDEQRVDERPFSTVYYNAAIHRGALAAPEFFVRAMAEQGLAK